MPVASVVSFSSLDWGLGALALGVAAIAVARWRRIDVPAVSAWLMSGGIVLLALAAAGPVWHRPRPGTIAVMVDLSPSTRGAHFRNPDFLRRRLGQLIGDAPFRLIAFAAENRPLDPAGPFDEMPADRTVFSPPNADAIVLFSDARFDLPDQSPPVYVALDEGLENVADGSVRNLEVRGNSLATTIANTGPSREASFPDSTMPVGTGTFVVTRPIPDGVSTATVKLNPSDLWPENDSLTLAISAVPASEKWWIGRNPPGDGWRSFRPEQTPILTLQYLGPAVIVIDDQPAERFAPAQLDCLMQYVRDLGGSLLIVGGDHALAAGGYPGTTLEQISPLASSPPTPTMRWLLLADASGSMSQELGSGVSRWQAATGAMVKLLPALPPSDPVQIGQFSDAVRWWLGPGTVADAAKAPLPRRVCFHMGRRIWNRRWSRSRTGRKAKPPRRMRICRSRFCCFPIATRNSIIRTNWRVSCRRNTSGCTCWRSRAAAGWRRSAGFRPIRAGLWPRNSIRGNGHGRCGHCRRPPCRRLSSASLRPWCLKMARNRLEERRLRFGIGAG